MIAPTPPYRTRIDLPQGTHMAHEELTVAGLRITLRNMPGSAITRVSIDGKDAFGFDPETSAFVQFLDGQQVPVAPDLPAFQAFALRQALIKHSRDRDRAFATGVMKSRAP